MQQALQISPIFSIQLHINISHYFTFYNTYYIEVLRKYARGIIITIVEHQHPLHQLSDLPFAIVNATQVVARQQMQGLVEAVCMDRPIRVVFFGVVVKLCEELATVGRILSQQPSNPYYLLLSPIKKYHFHTHQTTLKKQFLQSTQYFNPYTEKLNQQHFLYKLDSLSTYLTKIDKTPIVVLCVYALMKSLKIDNKMLYQTVAKSQIFGRCQEEGLGIVGEGVRGDRGDMGDGVGVRFIGTVPKESQQKVEEKVNVSASIFTNPKLEFLSRLVVPVLAFTIFWRIQRGHSIPIQ